jgi:uncharacterized protein (DUF433 family)
VADLGSLLGAASIGGAFWHRVRGSIRLPAVAPAEADSMVPGDRAARIAGISRQRLYYWERTKLITPTHRKRLSPRVIVRLYDLQRLTELKVAAHLVVGHGATVQSLRPLLRYLRARYDAPLATLRYAVQNRRVYYFADGAWSPGLDPGQMMLTDVLPLEKMRATVRREAKHKRASEQVGRVVKVRGVQGSAPVFEGTRVPLASVWEFLDDDEPLSKILAAYPDLEVGDVRKAERMRQAAKMLRAGHDIVGIERKFADLSTDELRSIKQLKTVA